MKRKRWAAPYRAYITSGVVNKTHFHKHKVFLQCKAVLMENFFHIPYLSKSPVTVLLSGIAG